jgi:peptidoglycan/LPS O-acetylase OafA/YrhL
MRFSSVRSVGSPLSSGPVPASNPSSASRSPSETSSQRVGALDGLRGLAAVIVVIGHTIGAARQPPGIAAPSVMLFFVLSGYCLAASALRGDRLVDRAQFYIRRIFRIQPPFVFALLVAWGCSRIPHTGACCEGRSEWIIQFINLTLTPAALVGHMSFPGTAGNLMPIGWTLEVEMVFSLLLPLMVLLVRDGHWSVGLGLSIWALLQQSPAYAGQVYAIHFMVGILVHEGAGRLDHLANRAPRGMPTMLIVIFVYFTSIALGLIPGKWNIVAALGVPTYKLIVLTATAISSVALTVGAVHLPGFRRVLEWGPVAFLGRVSYSVYLLHFTVLLLLLRFVTERLGDVEVIGLIACVLSVTVVCAAAMHRLVELPSIRLGNWFCALLAQKTHTEERLSRILVEKRSRRP